jgi:hypothetical protein
MMTAGFVLMTGWSAAALANDQLERFEAISERGNEIMMEIMVRQYASMGMDAGAIRDAVPDGAWDDEYREAGQCALDRYRDLVGRSGVDDMLDQMEAMFASVDPETATMESMSELSELSAIEGISTDQQMAITKDCGLVEISMRRMQESGFMEIIQQQMMRQGGGS